MITGRGNKEFYGEFERERIKALENSSNFSQSTGAYSLDDLGVNEKGQGINDKETYLIDTIPIGSTIVEKKDKIDIRKYQGFD